MTSTNTYAPSREDFAALLDESYGQNEAFEGSVIKGRVVAIEKDVAVIDLGLKTEGRVPLKEFQGPGREGSEVASKPGSGQNPAAGQGAVGGRGG